MVFLSFFIKKSSPTIELDDFLRSLLKNEHFLFWYSHVLRKELEL